MTALNTYRRTLGIVAFSAAATLVLLAACSSSDNSTTETTTPQPPTFTATLAGANEVPAVNAPGTGSATVVFFPATGTPTSGSYTVTVTGLTGAPTVSHIHAPADTKTSTGVLVNFNPSSVTTTSGTFTGTFTQGDIRNPAVSVDSVMKLVKAGLAYVNVHTATNPGGEIRGQLVTKP